MSLLRPQNHFLLFVFLVTVIAIGYLVVSRGYSGFPGGSVVKEGACNAETQVPSLVREDPLEEDMTTHSSILAGKITWTEESAGYSPRGHKESDTAELLSSSGSVTITLASVMAKMLNIFSGSCCLFTYLSLWNIF